jgi:hypothetical protein
MSAKFFEEINIGSKFDAKGFKQAETALGKLNKTTKSLAGALGLAFGARAVAQYGKRSVAAFMADEKAAKSLTVALTNLNQSFADPIVRDFISSLERQYGIVDDLLRPAYQKLLQTTGSYIEAQSLLKTSLDLAANSGQDVVGVAADLARAYAGNTRGLLKYNLGLSKTQLQQMSFNEILAQAAKVTGGQASAALETYAGKMGLLQTAAANAQETIGKGLVQALAELGGSEGLPKTIKLIESLASGISTAIIGFGRLITITGMFLRGTNKKELDAYIKSFQEADAKQRRQYGGIYATMYQEQAAKNIQTNAVKANTTAVKKLTEKFDVRKAGISAALANPNISSDTRNRLLGLQALENGDSANSIKYGNLVKPNASMANPNATIVNIYPQGNVLTEQDLVTYIQDGLQTQSRRRGGGKLGPLIL